MKVKSSLVGNEQPTNQIDWDKPQLLSGKCGAVVMNTGTHNDVNFYFTVLVPSAIFPSVGIHFTTGDKDYFLPLPAHQQVTLQNSND
jgi:hypothetical protein